MLEAGICATTLALLRPSHTEHKRLDGWHVHLQRMPAGVRNQSVRNKRSAWVVAVKLTWYLLRGIPMSVI